MSSPSYAVANSAFSPSSIAIGTALLSLGGFLSLGSRRLQFLHPGGSQEATTIGAAAVRAGLWTSTGESMRGTIPPSFAQWRLRAAARLAQGTLAKIDSQ
jgi:hypothetical protein